ncbi:MAG: hypothetical protein CHACPFDD_03738 [Phycisphaerae bacterium]|nr:hypothetical protein [Phycisphaerae bacterium]
MAVATRSSGSMQARHREAIFERWRSDILREAIDLETLARVAARMGHDPDVRADAVLESELRGVLAEKEAELKAIRRRLDVDDAPTAPGSGVGVPGVGTAGRAEWVVQGEKRKAASGGEGTQARDAECSQGRQLSTETLHEALPTQQPSAAQTRAPGGSQSQAQSDVRRQREAPAGDAECSRGRLPSTGAHTPEQAALPESPSAAVNYVAHLRHQLEGYLAHGDAEAAEGVLARIEVARRRYPELMDEAEHERLAGRLEHVRRRQSVARARVEELARRALVAAAEGDHDTVSQVLRRLGVLHASIPGVLSDARYQQLHDQIVNASEVHEHREAARALLKRESEVAAEIRRMARAIRAFHDVARTAKAHHDVREAERAYREAEAELKAHDREWLAGLILEMLEMAEVCHGPRGRVERHVDVFVRSLREALERLGAEVREMEGGTRSE